MSAFIESLVLLLPGALAILLAEQTGATVTVGVAFIAFLSTHYAAAIKKFSGIVRAAMLLKARAGWVFLAPATGTASEVFAFGRRAAISRQPEGLALRSGRTTWLVFQRFLSTGRFKPLQGLQVGDLSCCLRRTKDDEIGDEKSNKDEIHVQINLVAWRCALDLCFE